MKALTFPLVSLLIAGSAVAEDWVELLNPQLSEWEVYVGVPHKTVEIPGGPVSTSKDGTKGTALGLGNDPLKIFKMIEEDGEPVLHISGQIYAGISTKKEFENYHVSLQFKWGEKKYEPRLTAIRVRHVLKPDNPLMVYFEITARLAADRRRPLKFTTEADGQGKFTVS